MTSLYGSDMTPVYSGGLVYEYTQEENKYGLVELSGSGVTENADFAALKSAYASTPMPSGDGGYKPNGKPSTCPAQSSTWLPGTDSLPAIPDGAVKYMTDGAGKGPGLKGNNGAGSQNAGGASTATATPGSGAVTATGGAASSTSKGAAASLHAPELSLAPFVCGLVVILSSMVGATFQLL